MKTLLKTIPVLFLILTIYTFQAYATWSNDTTVNNQICTTTGYQYNPAIVGDGSGGAIIVWVDGRSGDYDIYAQRINASGAVQWTSDGVPICTAAYDQYYPTIVSDGNGGAIISWTDARNSNYDIYAQKINTNGDVQWTADGIPVCTATDSQIYPIIVSNGSGGAIIAWYDYRSGDYDIYAQRINASGIIQWAVDGVPICTAEYDQFNPTIVSDGSSGAIITWVDYRNDYYDIYAQRINASGAVLWTADGVPVCTATYDQYSPTIASDGSGGAIITWYDSRNGNTDIYAQRINASGAVLWTADGVPISVATGSQYSPTIASDGSGGAIITWYDSRNGNADIYAQRINASGAVQWTADGVSISTATYNQYYPAIVSDGSSGAIITWRDARNGNADIYAQRINESGTFDFTTTTNIEISCQDIQKEAQDAVLARKPYKNKGQMVSLASHVVEYYEEQGLITEKCAGCIMRQFAKDVPIDQQIECP